MRVAWITHGGIGPPHRNVPAMMDLLQRLTERYNITVYLPASGTDSPSIRGVRIQPLETQPSGRGMLATSLRRVYKDHRKEPYDLLHGFWGYPGGFCAVVASKVLRLPCVISLHGGEGAFFPKIGYGLMRRQPVRTLTLWSIRSATGVIALTRFQLCSLRQYGIERDDALIIPYGADPERFGTQRRELPVAPFRFLHIANLTEIKDQGTLLKAFATIRSRVPAHLRIIGADYLGGRVQAMAASLGISSDIQFLSEISHDQLPDHYRWAQFMLHTSMYEGQGVVLSEAAASGVVLCGTRVGLLADLDETMAVTAEVGDYRTLAEKVLWLLEEPEHYATLQRTGLQWAEAHSANWTATQVAHVYARLIDGRSL